MTSRTAVECFCVVLAQAVGIVPTLIIVRAGLGLSMHDFQTAAGPLASTMDFPRHSLQRNDLVLTRNSQFGFNTDSMVDISAIESIDLPDLGTRSKTSEEENNLGQQV
ncbi:hypothetical protein C8J56DRAFT_137241 [Mycena floridula]|nr:hypothetical protein C8J56DRAFT_137241 [Mycena floridula]